MVCKRIGRQCVKSAGLPFFFLIGIVVLFCQLSESEESLWRSEKETLLVDGGDRKELRRTTG